jgi:hypothetical protein
MNNFNPTFDPMAVLEQLNNNQSVLFNNDKQLAAAIEDIRSVIKNQQEVIDVLQKGLDMANKANELLLTQGLNTLYKDFTSTGQH